MYVYLRQRFSPFWCILQIIVIRNTQINTWICVKLGSTFFFWTPFLPPDMKKLNVCVHISPDFHPNVNRMQWILKDSKFRVLRQSQGRYKTFLMLQEPVQLDCLPFLLKFNLRSFLNRLTLPRAATPPTPPHKHTQKHTLTFKNRFSLSGWAPPTLVLLIINRKEERETLFLKR